MNRPQVLKVLKEYFEKKGKILSIDEYKAATDAPMRFMVAKRAFGSWARMEQMLRTAGWNDTPAPAPKPKAKPAPKKAVNKGK
tara:strand:+ start:175 stop:423 length:249 start_codon:yes stop_codon:yes gene_type:complete